MSKHIHHIQAITEKDATGVIAQVYDQMRHDFGAVVEPVSLHAPSSQVLAGVWGILREPLVAGKKLDRGYKEAIAANVSQINACPWCVDAHTMMLHGTGNGDATEAVYADDVIAPASSKFGAIMAWAKATRTPDDAQIQNPPFPAEHAPEVIGTAVVFHYLNRVVTMLLSETFAPTSQWLNSSFKRVVGRIAVWMVRKNPFTPGESAQFLAELDETTLPDDLQWAQSDPTIKTAFANFATLNARFEATLAPEVVSCVRSRVETWEGEQMPLSRKWVEDAINTLSDTDKPIARLALLAALAPHQVEAGVIDAVRSVDYDDEQLVNLLAWASFTAARRIGQWLYVEALRPQSITT